MKSFLLKILKVDSIYYENLVIDMDYYCIIAFILWIYKYKEKRDLWIIFLEHFSFYGDFTILIDPADIKFHPGDEPNFLTKLSDFLSIENFNIS